MIYIMVVDPLVKKKVEIQSGNFRSIKIPSKISAVLIKTYNNNVFCLMPWNKTYCC